MGYVGWSEVANQANTQPGTALGVEAATYSGGAIGAGVAGSGVAELFASDPHPGDNLLLESGDNILLENGTDALLLE